MQGTETASGVRLASEVGEAKEVGLGGGVTTSESEAGELAGGAATSPAHAKLAPKYIYTYKTKPQIQK